MTDFLALSGRRAVFAFAPATAGAPPIPGSEAVYAPWLLYGRHSAFAWLAEASASEPPAPQYFSAKASLGGKRGKRRTYVIGQAARDEMEDMQAMIAAMIQAGVFDG